ncbi:MAG: M43 family zinc metalloprotease [Bacteroidetes bacterium]|nr:M43 family zinc metalloprotease [Bacteroidota bacterium]
MLGAFSFSFGEGVRRTDEAKRWHSWFGKLTIAAIFFLFFSSHSQAQTDSSNSDFKKYGRCLFGKFNPFKNNVDSASPTPPWSSENYRVEDNKIYILPVVVHVVFADPNKAAGKLTDAQIQNEIQVMNEDFGKYGDYNGGSLGVDSRIRFCLVEKDPNGNPSTGITRTYSPQGKMTTANEMAVKNLVRWDQRRYLNFWVVDQINGSDNLAGYAYLPSSMVTQDSIQQEDGIVVNHKFFGRNTPLNINNYRLGRTPTHETGHYFELLHPWGDDEPGPPKCGDDKVDDTPPCKGQFTAKPFPSGDSCNHPWQCNNRRQIENFMDYSFDNCMNTFTQGQVLRMRKAIRQYRETLISYPNLVKTGCYKLWNDSNAITENQIDIYPNPATSNLNFYFFLKEKQNLSFTFYDALGRLVEKVDNIQAQTGSYNLYLPNLKPGFYSLLITAPDKTYVKKVVIGER